MKAYMYVNSRHSICLSVQHYVTMIARQQHCGYVYMYIHMDELGKTMLMLARYHGDVMLY